MRKLRKHGYKNWLQAVDIELGSCPHNPIIVYNRESGFKLTSNLIPLDEGDIVADEHWEPYGTSVTEYRNAANRINYCSVCNAIFEDDKIVCNNCGIH